MLPSYITPKVKALVRSADITFADIKQATDQKSRRFKTRIKNAGDAKADLNNMTTRLLTLPDDAKLETK